MKIKLPVKVVKLQALSFLFTILIPMAAMAVTNHSGTIGTETWEPPNTHYVTANVTVSDGQVLTIMPGTVVKFAPNTQLLVYGTLKASGTAVNSIVFTSRDDNSLGETVSGSDGTPTPGNWYGIYLNGQDDNDGIGEFDYCLLRYGGYGGGAVDANVLFSYSDSGYMKHCTSEHSGQHGVKIFNCSPEITASTLHDNVLSGLYASGGGEPKINNNTFTDNHQYGAHVNLTGIIPLISDNTGSGNQINALVFQGNVTASQTWASTPGFPIVLLSSVTVSDNVVLTIEPSTVIKFYGNYQLLVNGTLDVNGSEGNQVVFTSLKDDYDGDTNGDGGASSPAPGNWYGIYLNGQDDNDGIGEFDYCLLRYGGYGGGAVDANVLFSYSDSGYMKHCTSEHSGQHGVKIFNCSPEITASTLHDNVLSGLYASGGGEPKINNNTFTDNHQYGAHVNLTGIIPLISDNTGSGNQINALVFQGNVTASQTWASTPGFPIVLLSSVTVSDNVVLTIEPSTVIKFYGNYQLLVNGTLDVNGSEGNQVVFTSLKDDYDGDTNGDGGASSPAPGNWYGIYLNGQDDNDGIGEFDYCLLRYGGYGGGAVDANVLFSYSDSGYMKHCTSEHSGQHGVKIFNCSPEITASTLHDNVLSGLYASGGGEPKINNNTFTDNHQYGAHVNLTGIIPLISDNTGSGNQINALVFQGNVTASQTWASTPGFPIVLLSSVTVSDNVVLTIEPSTVIKFYGNYQLLVNGTLDVNGSEGNQVVFTSLKDDYDGDTNGDGGASSPAPGNWYGIYLNGQDDNDGIGEFDYCLLRYGGYGGGAVDANVLFSYSDSGYMKHCTSEHSGQHGVKIFNCSPQIINSTLSKNTLYGVSVSSGSPQIINSIVWGNTSGGISGAPVVAYSDIQGVGLFAGEGNINANPLFLDATNSDYRLDFCSPAIDAGDPVEILTADYNPVDRIIDVNKVTSVENNDIIWITDSFYFESDEVSSTTGDTVTINNGFTNSYTVSNRSFLYTASSDYLNESAPTGFRINMGAFGGGSEATPSIVCRGDIEGEDQDVDALDLREFLNAYGSSTGDADFNPAADMNKDGTVDHNDLFMFAAEFGRIDCPVCP